MKKLILMLSIAFLFFGCAQPRTSVVTDGQEGAIQLKVIPGSAEVFLDGVSVGKARQFDGTSQLMKVSPGKHEIKLVASGYKEYITKVYISDSQELIQVKLEKME